MYNATARIPENATCESVFPTLQPPVLNYLCTLTEHDNDTASQIYHSLCCAVPIPTVKDDNGFHEFFQDMCHSPNITEEMRQEFCSVLPTPMIPFSPQNPFSISPATYTLMSLLTPIGILANLLIIFTVLKCKKLRTTTGYFICNLAIADLLCILCMISYLITETQIMVSQNVVALLIFSSIDVFIGSASLLHVTAASVERAIAVAKPMVYPMILNKGRAKRVISLIWCYCSIIFLACCARVFLPKTHVYWTVIFFFAVTFSFAIPCALVLISYVNISIKALKNLQMEKKIERSLIVVSMLNDTQRKSSRHHHQIRELKLALNLTVMTAPFVFGWGYFMIGNVYEEITQTALTGYKNWFLNMLPYLISCINPITYLLFTKTLRKEALKLLMKPFRKFRLLQQRRFSSTSLILSSTKSPRASDCSETRMV